MTHRGLDSFRFFAFLAVFLYHVSLLPAGYLGVQAFFVLSGFLLTPILVGMRRSLPPRQYFVNFYGRRGLRIFPLYYVYLATLSACAAFAVAIGVTPPAIQTFVRQSGYAFTYTYDFFHASRVFHHSWLLTHFWSLAVEEQFYLVWPFIVLCVATKRLKHILLFMIVLGPLIRVGELVLITGWMADLSHNRLDMVIYVLPFSHLDAFAAGGYLALYGRPPSRFLVSSYIVLLISVGMMTERVATGTNGVALGYGPFMADSWKFLWGYSCFNILFGCILLMLRDRTLVPTIVEHPALVYLGRVSYGLYVYHFGIIWALSLTNPERLQNAPVIWRVIYACVIFGVTALVSTVSYEYLEAPFLRLKDRYFPTGSGQPTTEHTYRANDHPSSHAVPVA